jgi:hypothetical protein
MESEDKMADHYADVLFGESVKKHVGKKESLYGRQEL